MPGISFRFFLSFILVLFVTVSMAQVSDILIEGTLLTESDKDPIPFAHVAVGRSGHGGFTDVDGRFEISYTGGYPFWIKFSAVGYKEDSLRIVKPGKVEFYLTSTQYELQEIVILPGENPAELVMKKAVDNRNMNDPRKALKSWYYVSYNKMTFYPGPIPGKKKPSREKKANAKLLDMQDEQYLAMMETVSQQFYNGPGKTREKVRSTRFSGFKEPGVALLGTEFQSFSFYGPEINLGEKSYMGPVSKIGLRNYLFMMEDTVFMANGDSVFRMRFQPKSGKNIMGLKGDIHIHSRGYAIQHVQAKPSEVSVDGIGLEVVQKYESLPTKSGKHQWFPVQLNTTLHYQFMQLTDSLMMVGEGKSYLDSIVLDTLFSTWDKNAPDMVIPQKSDTTVISAYRKHELTSKEKETYHQLDSIGEAQNIDASWRIMRYLLAGYLRMGKVDLVLSQLLGFNEYEGFRTGIGLKTNENLSKWFTLYGNIAYGWRDEDWKYKSGLEVHLIPKKIAAEILWQKDVFEPGGRGLTLDYPVFSSAMFRPFLVSRMDIVEGYKAGLKINPNRTHRFKLWYTNQTRTPTYGYLWWDAPNGSYQSEFSQQEVRLDYHFQPGVQQIEMGDISFEVPEKKPQLLLSVRKGLNKFDYTSAELQFLAYAQFGGVGSWSVNVRAGKVWGNAPYSLLLGEWGSWQKDWGVHTDYSFQSMPLNRYISDESVGVFQKFTYRPWVLTKWSKPSLSVVFNNGWGNLSEQRFSSVSIPLRGFDRGYHETGLVLEDVIRYGLTGFGASAIYNYGHYSLPTWSDNLYYRITGTIAF